MSKTVSPVSRRTRVEKSNQVRAALLDAAIDVVGKYGYAGASISRITARAKVGQGTFYNYFESRNAILDELLPTMGEMMLDFIRKEVSPPGSELDREMQRFDAFFKFLVAKPQFYRVLNEAELFAPAGYQKHFANLTNNYNLAFAKAHARGEMPDYDDQELEVLVAILMAIKGNLGQRYAYANGKVSPIPDFVRRTYEKLIKRGIFGPISSAD
ncbi:TetR/AcrR family transcriptional regulator [Pseudochelatococcus sp. B33]